MQIVFSTLMEAKKLIERRGWVQRALCTSDGYCITGAIAAVQENESLRDLAFDCIRKECASNLVVKWNDQKGRTKRQVINLIDKAARRALKLKPQGRF